MPYGLMPKLLIFSFSLPSESFKLFEGKKYKWFIEKTLLSPMRKLLHPRFLAFAGQSDSVCIHAPISKHGEFQKA